MMANKLPQLGESITVSFEGVTITPSAEAIENALEKMGLSDALSQSSQHNGVTLITVHFGKSHLNLQISGGWAEAHLRLTDPSMKEKIVQALQAGLGAKQHMMLETV